mmetsp:Transcript_3726/g.15059  ORF Transcript_3726/g.15059 Transcript_3726/m.15059 type:complete len:353 (-) Transcript_3726:618-1676(-)
MSMACGRRCSVSHPVARTRMIPWMALGTAAAAARRAWAAPRRKRPPSVRGATRTSLTRKPPRWLPSLPGRWRTHRAPPGESGRALRRTARLQLCGFARHLRSPSSLRIARSWKLQLGGATRWWPPCVSATRPAPTLCTCDRWCGLLLAKATLSSPREHCLSTCACCQRPPRSCVTTCPLRPWTKPSRRLSRPPRRLLRVQRPPSVAGAKRMVPSALSSRPRGPSASASALAMTKPKMRRTSRRSRPRSSSRCLSSRVTRSRQSCKPTSHAAAVDRRRNASVRRVSQRRLRRWLRAFRSSDARESSSASTRTVSTAYAHSSSRHQTLRMRSGTSCLTSRCLRTIRTIRPRSSC